MNEKMTLTQLMEYYYNDDLSFVDIVRMLSQKKIMLENGTVSDAELKVIINEKNLPSLDKREFKIIESAEQPEEAEEDIATPEELETIISQSEKNIYKLEKDAKKNGGNERELIEEYEKMCNTYDKLYNSGKQTVSVERMISCRKKFKDLLEKARNPDKIKTAENLMKLGELQLKARQYDASLHELNEAKYTLEEQINGIKIIDAREKSEFSAKLGVVHYHLYLTKNKIKNENKDIERHLETAERLLARYTQENTQNPYYTILNRIRREIQKCRKE